MTPNRIPPLPPPLPSKAIPRRRGLNCWGCGCLATGIPLLIILLLVGWVAGIQTGWFEKVGLRKSPEDRLLGGAPNYAAADALKAVLLASGYSDSGLDVAVLPVKGYGYNLAVVEMDASRGFKGSGSGELLLESFQRLATSAAADQYAIGRVALHYKDQQGNKVVSLTAKTADILAYSSGQISRQDFLKAVEGQVDIGDLLGGAP